MSGADRHSRPDLAVRSLGGSVVAANDELFAERENLIRPEAPGHRPATFGHRGQVYDGWETRRRRQPGHDWAIVRLGLAGVVRGVVVDTAFLKGNNPPEVSVEGASAEGHPTPDELQQAEWVPLVPRSAVEGDSANRFEVDVPWRFTHVRLCLYPDGGVARLRVHGTLTPDARADLALRWLNLLPEPHARQVLQAGGLAPAPADRLVGSRPLTSLPDLPQPLNDQLGA